MVWAAGIRVAGLCCVCVADVGCIFRIKLRPCRLCGDVVGVGNGCCATSAGGFGRLAYRTVSDWPVTVVHCVLHLVVISDWFVYKAIQASA